MEREEFLGGTIVVTRESPTRWVARLPSGHWMESSWSPADAVGRLCRRYPNAVMETIVLKYAEPLR